jgi:hypothetical protein
MLVVSGIYALGVHYFRPEAFSPKMTPTLIRVLAGVAILSGFLVAFSRFIFAHASKV